MRTPPRVLIRTIAQFAAMAGISAMLLAPAEAQFWPFGGGSTQQRQPQRQQQRQQQQYNPFGGWFGSGSDYRSEPRRVQPRIAVDYSQAPAPARKSAEAVAAVTSPIVVMGDGMADWLAYGLEDAFADRPEFGVVRKHRSTSGLIRYDPRRDVEWPQVAREIIAAEHPKFIVMMVGFHDHQAIRDRAPGPATPARAAARAPQPAPPDDEDHDPNTPEARARASAEQQNAEMERAKQPSPAAPSEPAHAAATGPMEFQSEAWQAAYIQRIDATIAALKSAGVPVFWVGLPPQRNARLSADAVFLNDLFRARAERAGIIYVDIWDGFVDEAGRFLIQGADIEGQIRRLRSGDFVYFTLAGARKLAHYVEREILRSLLSRDTPLPLPLPEPAAVETRPGAARPVAGPVIPLTASMGGSRELLGGAAARPAASDPVASRVLVRGEAITAPPGRADNFVWPRGTAVAIPEGEATVAPLPSRAAAPPVAPAAKAAPPAAGPHAKPHPGEARQAPVPRRIPRASADSAPRPPLSIGPR